MHALCTSRTYFHSTCENNANTKVIKLSGQSRDPIRFRFLWAKITESKIPV